MGHTDTFQTSDLQKLEEDIYIYIYIYIYTKFVWVLWGRGNIKVLREQYLPLLVPLIRTLSPCTEYIYVCVHVCMYRYVITHKHVDACIAYNFRIKSLTSA